MQVEPARGAPARHEAGADRPGHAERPGRAVFEVDGLCCAAEARQLEGRLGRLPGVSHLAVDPVRHRLVVDGGITPETVERAVADLGMRARRIAGGPGPATQRSHRTARGRVELVVASGLLWALSLTAGGIFDLEAAAAALAVGSMVAGGWLIVPRGLRAVRHRALDMNALMTLAAVGALLIGEYAEAATALFLFALAQLLEAGSMDRARNAIQALLDLSPAEASVLRGGRAVRIPAERVEVGEVILVRPGEKFAVDGVVVAGRSSVDQSPITGESVPVEKDPGSEVFAGSLNGEGVIEVRSTRPAADTTLARIIHSIEEAHASRAPSQAFVDRFARIYTPGVVAAAAVFAVLPPLVGVDSWSDSFYRALVLLVVACPCALVISTPVTIVSALAGAARRGILIKAGLHLENAGRARVVAFDKTGTLTEGRPEVIDVVPLGAADPDELLALAAAVEARSEHPLARAILRRAGEAGIRIPPATEVSAVTGRGITARVHGRWVVVGSARFFREREMLTAETEMLLRGFEAAGRTAVLVGATPVRADGADGAVPIGALAIADRVRPQAPAALRALHRSGIERVVMLTGDTAATARAVADALGGPGAGIDEIRAGLLPGDKVAAIEDLRRRHGRVLMVGDGVNDAPALAAADVGIAMGSAGTDVALETADIALMADDLARLPRTIRYARKAESIIRTNIAFSLALKGVFIALAAAGLATLWMAVLADMGASLLVTANGLRALRA